MGGQGHRGRPAERPRHRRREPHTLPYAVLPVHEPGLRGHDPTDADRSWRHRPVTAVHARPDWFTDAYTLSPGEKHLLTVTGAEHPLGGVHTYGGMPMTPSDNPAQVALVQQVSTAYLRSALGVGEEPWATLRASLTLGTDPLGQLESK